MCSKFREYPRHKLGSALAVLEGKLLAVAIVAIQNM
jgi:hypothetical protein